MDQCAEWDRRYADYFSDLPANLVATMSSVPATGSLKRRSPLAPMLANPTERFVRLLILHLKDEQAKWFVAGVAEIAPSIADVLMGPLLDAGVDELNPSFNNLFVEPCMRVFGARRVNEYLLRVVESGTDFQKAGALNASYWARVGLSFDGGCRDFSIEHATPESRAAYESLSDVWQRWKHLVLETFVSNPDLDVRRSAIPHIDLDETSYDWTYRPLVAQAIAIARSHPDDYIRHRLEVQLGTTRFCSPLPYREK
jgi:hypothetical protein